MNLMEGLGSIVRFGLRELRELTSTMQTTLGSKIHNHIRHSNRVFAAILLLFVLGLGMPLFIQARAEAQDKQVVSIYVNGETRRSATDAATVAEALEQADVVMGKNDIAEPDLDTPISQDSFNINVYRARPVTVFDRDQRVQVLTAFQSPQLIAQAAGLQVYDEDTYSFDRVTDFVGEQAVGLKLTIYRATPVNINLYGSVIEVRTHGSTVSDVLVENDIELGDEDKVKPSKSAEVTRGMKIDVISVGREIIAREESTPFGTTIIYDTNMLVNISKVKTPGVKGTRLVTFEVTFHDGKEASRKKIQTVVSKQPKNEVRIVGTQVPNTNSNARIGKKLAAARGWTDEQWSCLYSLWDHESHWNHTAQNSSSSAYGIPQALPGFKMAGAGADWQTNPATQIKWGLNYIAGRYGSPCGAFNHWQNNNWY